jgi:hypothetical protein
MRTLAEAERSIKQAMQDRAALRISEATLQALRNQLQARIMKAKKRALLSSAAKIVGRQR